MADTIAKAIYWLFCLLAPARDQSFNKQRAGMIKYFLLHFRCLFLAKAGACCPYEDGPARQGGRLGLEAEAGSGPRQGLLAAVVVTEASSGRKKYFSTPYTGSHCDDQMCPQTFCKRHLH